MKRIKIILLCVAVSVLILYAIYINFSKKKKDKELEALNSKLKDINHKDDESVIKEEELKNDIDSYNEQIGIITESITTKIEKIKDKKLTDSEKDDILKRIGINVKGT